MSRYAAWRRRSASAKALAMLYKMKGVVADQESDSDPVVTLFGKTVPASKLTAGEVASFL